MSDFLHRQARKERKEREFYTRFLGIRRERAAPYPRESPRRSTPMGQVPVTEQTEEGEAGAPRGSDAPQAPQPEISEIPTTDRSSPPKRRREDDDDDGTFN